MTASLPKSRNDLVTSRQVTSKGVVFVIKDPVRDSFYRLPEEAYFILENLDGETPISVVRQRVEEKFQASLTPAELAGFIGGLDDAGLLENGRNQRKSKRARRIQGSPLYLRIRFLDPDRLFNFLAPRIRFFFTPLFMMISAATILSAAYIAITNWTNVVDDLPRLLSYSSIPLIVAVVFLVVTMHEFAHGLTCKHFGGEVHELGFFLVYLQPALYCNVSDAWLFPEKSKRLWVGFAGPYFELFLWGLATLTWWLTDVETWINYLALIVVTTSGIKTLFNFNPLIKLDGYYLLSDWLEIPNLRKKGFACFSGAFKRLFGVRVPLLEQMPARELRLCMMYGLVAGIGSMWLLSYAVVKIGSTLIEQSQPIAFAVSGWFLAVKARRHISRLRGKTSANSADPDDFDSIPDDKPTTMTNGNHNGNGNGHELHDESSRVPATTKTAGAVERAATESSLVRAPESAIATTESAKPSKPKRKKNPWGKRLLVLAVLAGLAALFIYKNAELRIKGPFDMLPVQNADVRAAVEGIVDEINVEEGQTVKEGDLIARLSDRDQQAELRKVEGSIGETEAKLKLLLAGPRPEEIDQARIEVAKDTDAIAFSTSHTARFKTLYEEKLLSIQELEDAQAILAQQKSDLEIARRKLDVLLAGSRPEEIEAMRATLTSLQTQRSYLEEQIRLMKVVSPASGIVATPARQLMEMKHQLVKKGDLIAKVDQLKTITAEIVISERDIADVKVGQKVVLKARAFPEMTFYGKVTAIATVAQSSSSSTSTALAQLQGNTATPMTRNTVAPKTITITSEIDNNSLLLKPEMTGQAKIYVGKRRLFELATRRVARTVKVEFWSWW